MPRPRKLRTVREPVPARVYKPAGVPRRDLDEIVLTLDALEALRLADAEGFEHAAAAAQMGVSRPTFSRLIAEARTTVATALIQGWALRIEGGPARVAEDGAVPCCGRGMRRRRGHCGRLGPGRAVENATEEAAGTAEPATRPAPSARRSDGSD
ncbi:DUF134 domain-containing protein [Rhodoplanes azumiensis]|uniref:UPF0251 protein ACFSOX_05135 n=1 Tax=Rhodoplanes azumiensis TaxID=1897628 RepID=A0ABW5AF12_9BRAD